MSSRIAEKQRRKAERVAAERKADERAARERRLRIAAAGLVSMAVVVAVVLVLTGGGGSTSPSANGPVALDIKGISLPVLQIKDLKKAAAAAGCALHSYPPDGVHVTTSVTYKTNPPTTGNHNPVPASDGVYSPANTPAKENLVHSLEHGRVEVQYRPGTPVPEIRELEALWSESDKGIPGYKQLLFQNNTNMPANLNVAATAWGQIVACPTFNPQVFDALRDFRDAYVDKGAEMIAPT